MWATWLLDYPVVVNVAIYNPERTTSRPENFNNSSSMILIIISDMKNCGSYWLSWFFQHINPLPTCLCLLTIRAYHKSKISLNFFGTCIFSWVSLYINVNFWFWQIFFIFWWVKNAPEGVRRKKYKKPHILVPMHFWVKIKALLWGKLFISYQNPSLFFSFSPKKGQK